MIRNVLLYVKALIKFVIAGRRKNVLLVVPLLASLVVAVMGCWWFAVVTTRFLLPPPPPDQNLEHLRRNRSLMHYMDKIQLLIEPSSTGCDGVEEVPVLILVASHPKRYEHRQAIRQTWAKHQPTYFIMGLNGDHVDEQLVDNYVEAKQYRDLIVYDFADHYQNLTLKTALMMQWTIDRCSVAQFMFKVDDDVLVNPWALRKVLQKNIDAKMLGYRENHTYLHRDEYTKWYLPRWLCPDDEVEQYLNGPAYLVNGDYLELILKAARMVPLVNMEDIYFSYMVARKTLGYELIHDRRLSPHKPWVPGACAYWGLASSHSHLPSEIKSIWPKLESIAKRNTSEICQFYSSLLSNDLFLY